MNCAYSIFGLNIVSSIPLPAAPIPFMPKNAQADVIVEYGEVPDALPYPQIKRVRFQASPGQFLLKVDGIGRYYVQNGNRISVEPDAGACADDLLVFLMGSAFGALLHQRKILVLHAGAIAANGESVIFSGPSGVGKSTLAAGFHKRGYSFLADDVCAVTMNEGHPAVIPGFPRLKLWDDVLEKLNADKDALQSVRVGTELKKFFLPIEDVQNTPVPVKSIFFLETANTDRMEITPLQAGEKLEALIYNTYRKPFLKGLGGKKEHFRQCADVAAKTKIYRVIRPKKHFLLNELMELVESRFFS